MVQIQNGFDRYYLSIKKTENQPEDIHKQPQKEENENDNDIVQSNNATNDKSAIPNESTSTNTIIKSNTTIFKVQFLSTQSQLPSNSPKLKDMSKVDYYKEGNTYKYTCGATTDLKEIQAIKAKVSQTYKDAFIVAFQNGVKVNTTDAINEYKASH